MLAIKQTAQKIIDVLIKFLPVLSFGVPFLVLYLDRQTSILYYSFEMTWKGRTFYLFFLWLAVLEIILGWDTLHSLKVSKLRLSRDSFRSIKVNKRQTVRAAAFLLALLLPSVYLIASNYYSFPSRAIIDWAWQNFYRYQPANMQQQDWIPLDVEYFVLAGLFALIIWLQYGAKGLKNILISPVFLAMIGTIYTIDNVYRFGTFTPFQIFVPTTAMLAARLLNFLGYQTQLTLSGSVPYLYASTANSAGNFGAFIDWPCSGIESLVIYSVVILLFLKNAVFSWIQRAIYFVVGAVVTYIINVFRIVTIFVIAIHTGGYYTGSEAEQFHNYYGQLYSIIWIVSYVLVIIGSQVLWDRFRNRKAVTPVRLDFPDKGT
jgi:exosortase/archaeosortase family protein